MASGVDRVLGIEVTVSVRLGERSLSLAEVVGLVPGCMIELPNTVDDPLELCIGDKAIGAGSAVKVAENFGLRVSFIGDPRARVQAMVGQGTAPQAAAAPPPRPDEDAELSALADALLADQ